MVFIGPAVTGILHWNVINHAITYKTLLPKNLALLGESVKEMVVTSLCVQVLQDFTGLTPPKRLCIRRDFRQIVLLKDIISEAIIIIM